MDESLHVYYILLYTVIEAKIWRRGRILAEIRKNFSREFPLKLTGFSINAIGTEVRFHNSADEVINLERRKKQKKPKHNPEGWLMLTLLC